MAQLANDSSYGLIALKFSQALANREFDTAYGLLSPRVREAMSKSDLIEQYDDMISYGDGPADLCEVMIVDDDIPSFIKNDLAWVYVAICGPGFSEAVAVIVMKEGDGMALRIADWCRP